MRRTLYDYFFLAVLGFVLYGLIKMMAALRGRSAGGTHVRRCVLSDLPRSPSILS